MKKLILVSFLFTVFANSPVYALDRCLTFQDLMSDSADHNTSTETMVAGMLIGLRMTVGLQHLQTAMKVAVHTLTAAESEPAGLSDAQKHELAVYQANLEAIGLRIAKARTSVAVYRGQAERLYEGSVENPKACLLAIVKEMAASRRLEGERTLNQLLELYGPRASVERGGPEFLSFAVTDIEAADMIKSYSEDP